MGQFAVNGAPRRLPESSEQFLVFEVDETVAFAFVVVAADAWTYVSDEGGFCVGGLFFEFDVAWV